MCLKRIFLFVKPTIHWPSFTSCQHVAMRAMVIMQYPWFVILPQICRKIRMDASVLMLGAHEQDGLDDRLSLDGSAATCTRHVVPPHTLSSPQYTEYLPTYAMGSLMKMIMRNLLKVSQIWSTIADAFRWEASACELCITPRCLVSCCVSQPLYTIHILCALYIVPVYGTQLCISHSRTFLAPLLVVLRMDMELIWGGAESRHHLPVLSWLGSIAVSIFVDILVELTHTVFVNSTNILEAEQWADIIPLLYPDHISRCWLGCNTCSVDLLDDKRLSCFSLHFWEEKNPAFITSLAPDPLVVTWLVRGLLSSSFS